MPLTKNAALGGEIIDELVEEPLLCGWIIARGREGIASGGMGERFIVTLQAVQKIRSREMQARTFSGSKIARGEPLLCQRQGGGLAVVVTGHPAKQANNGGGKEIAVDQLLGETPGEIQLTGRFEDAGVGLNDAWIGCSNLPVLPVERRADTPSRIAATD